MTTHLVVAEYDASGIRKSALSVVSAAQKIDGDVVGLLVGAGAQAAAGSLSPYVSRVIVVENDAVASRLAQPYAKVIADVAVLCSADMVWAAASVAGKDVMPRVAARLDAGMASDICAVVSEDTFDRPMWAGNVIATVKLTTSKKVITVRPTEFPPALTGVAGQIDVVDVDPGTTSMRYVGFDAVKSERPELTDAKIVVSGGRGLKGPEGFKEIIEPLADFLGAAIGASRAVCDAGWVPNDWQVGQTGKVVAPNLYIAIGISGAIQHVAGMKGSKCVVAINKDPEAPIFKIADYGLVADAFKAVPELLTTLKAG